jgi:hypothetical protein
MLRHRIGGDRVTDTSEREALLQILVRTEEIHALSTKEAQRELERGVGLEYSLNSISKLMYRK